MLQAMLPAGVAAAPFGLPSCSCRVAGLATGFASDGASYVSGARVAVTGGKPIL